MKIAWVSALLWGGFSVTLSALGPLGFMGLEQSMVVGLTGLLIVSLGLAVKRGNAPAAWCLAVVAAGEVVLRLWQRMWLLGPVVFFVITLRGALYLHKHRSVEAEGQSWVHMVYELAFLQAGWTAVVVAWTLSVEPAALQGFLGQRFSIMNLIDVVLAAGFGYAAWKRQPWAGYALLLYQLMNVHLQTMTASPTADVAIPFGFALIYGVGGLHLHRLHGPMTRGGKVAIVLIAAVVLAASVHRELRRPPFYQRLVQEFSTRLLAIPGYKERLLASKTDPARAAAEITLKGARRLADAELIERARLLGIILSVLDEHNCAEQFRAGRGTIEPALPKVPRSELLAWFELSYAASAAEIENTAPAMGNPSDDETTEAMFAVLGTLPTDDAARFVKIAFGSEGSFESVNDSDACWFLRTIIENFPRLEERHQRTIARLLVAQ